VFFLCHLIPHIITNNNTYFLFFASCCCSLRQLIFCHDHFSHSPTYSHKTTTEIVYEWLGRACFMKNQIQSDVMLMNDADDDDDDNETEFLSHRRAELEEDQDNYGGDNEEDGNNKRSTMSSTPTPTMEHEVSATNRVVAAAADAALLKKNEEEELYNNNNDNNNNNNDKNNNDTHWLTNSSEESDQFFYTNGHVYRNNENHLRGVRYTNRVRSSPCNRIPNNSSKRGHSSSSSGDSDSEFSGTAVTALRAVATNLTAHPVYTKKSRLQLICNKICDILANERDLKPHRSAINKSMVKVLTAYLIRNERNKLNEKRHYGQTSNSALSKIDVSHRRDIVFLTRQQFQELLRVGLALYEYSKPSRKDDLKIACQIRERKRPLIVLFGGTSGCGKSTLASLLASRLGITKVLSTDSVRHMLRGFISKEQNPILFASTYHAGEFLKDRPQYANMTADELVIEGYRHQCRIVIDQLDKIITNCIRNNEPLVVEGVHLLPDFMIELMKKYPNAIVPYVIYISNDSKHKERFAFRAKYMTLEPRNNKYVQYFEHIRQIQGYICKRADLYDVPKIDNTNIDRSLATIHASVFKSIKKVALNNECLYDLSTNKAKISRTYTKPKWTSSSMLSAIRTKRSSLELNVSQIGLAIQSSNRRLALHTRSNVGDESDTDSDESTRTDDGSIIHVVDEDDVRDGSKSESPLSFSPKLSRFDRNHRRTARNRRRSHFSNLADNEMRGPDEGESSGSDQETPQQLSDTEIVGSLSEFSDSTIDVRHLDLFDAS